MKRIRLSLIISFFYLCCLSSVDISGEDLVVTPLSSLIEEISVTYEVRFLEDINYSPLELIKECRTWNRTVYYDPIHKLYIKIWPRNYALSEYFINAVKKYFYKEITPLMAIFFDKEGHCRGYITQALDSYKVDSSFIQVSNERIAVLSSQSDSYKKFFEALKERVLMTGLIYYDLTPANIGYDGTNYFLVDLEPVLDIESCGKNVFNFNEFLENNPPEYIEFVKSLLCDNCPTFTCSSNI